MRCRFLKISSLAVLFLGCSPSKESISVKSLLVQQLKNAHTHEEWYSPMQKALSGLKPTQSNWKDSTLNHSIDELSSHLLFWNETILKAINGEEVSYIDDELTFQYKSTIDWDTKLKMIDSIQSELEIVVSNFSNREQEKWENDIVNLTAHTAYHTGQIIYIRKHKGWWK